MTWVCRDCGERITGRKLEHCPECHQTFTCTRSGDLHRAGAPSARRCLPPVDMMERGLTLNTRGHWMTARK